MCRKNKGGWRVTVRVLEVNTQDNQISNSEAERGEEGRGEER